MAKDTRKHVKNYMKTNRLGPDDVVLCRRCYKPAVDLHHIQFKSQQGSDECENLLPVCRDCHDYLHGKGLTNDAW